jgi:hypothetical protein
MASAELDEMGVPAASGGGRAAEALGDEIPGVVMIAGTGDGVGKAAVGFGDEADEDGEGGAGVIGVAAAVVDGATDEIIDQGAEGGVGEGAEGEVREVAVKVLPEKVVPDVEVGGLVDE